MTLFKDDEMDILAKLNENQKAAVQHTEGPLLILAGAGSGKTRVITHRIANIIYQGLARPHEIFAVTFTNKAAQELRDRLVSLIGPEGSLVFAKTFHSAAVYMLRRFGSAIGISPSFSIYDAMDQAAVAKSILEDMNIDTKKIKPSSMVSKISEIKEKADFIKGISLSALMPDNMLFDFEDFYNQYQNRLSAANALDFNDLLIRTVDLLRKSPESLDVMQNQWKYFMIDEYQDTSYAQYVIARTLASKTQNICVVGDDDQSIYSWRGADLRNILDFEKDYASSRTITLEENYRSTEPIIFAASSLIKNNTERKDKKVKAVNGDGEPIVSCRANNEYGEAEFVADQIVSLRHRENYAYRDFAVFYRTNAQSRNFEMKLRAERIPYKIVGGLKFYDRKEIKDIVSYLKFIVNTKDDVSLLRIINVPARGIGPATLGRLRSAAAAGKCSLWDAVCSPGETKLPKGLEDFRQFISGMSESAAAVPATLKLSRFVQRVIELSGYRESLVQDKTPENESRLENLDEFINSVADYEQDNPEAGPADFLQDVSLLTSEDTPEGSPEDRDNAVTLMTIHNAKGLEFPVVFLTGLEENLFPHKLSMESDAEIEEERRLCYVGITRAKERLFLTSCELRRNFESVEYRRQSRFLEEIPQELVEEKYYTESGGRGLLGGYGRGTGGYAGGGSSSSASFRRQSREPDSFRSSGHNVSAGSFSAGALKERLRSEVKIPAASAGHGSGSAFRPGDRVRHPKYGYGVIQTVEGTGDNIRLNIVFGTSRKVFMEKYTPLEKV